MVIRFLNGPMKLKMAKTTSRKLRNIDKGWSLKWANEVRNRWMMFKMGQWSQKLANEAENLSIKLTNIEMVYEVQNGPMMLNMW